MPSCVCMCLQNRKAKLLASYINTLCHQQKNLKVGAFPLALNMFTKQKKKTTCNSSIHIELIIPQCHAMTNICGLLPKDEFVHVYALKRIRPISSNLDTGSEHSSTFASIDIKQKCVCGVDFRVNLQNLTQTILSEQWLWVQSLKSITHQLHIQCR